MLNLYKFNFKLLLILAVILSSHINSNGEVQPAVFSFLKSIKTGQNDVSGEYIMENYLIGNSNNLIESITCKNIRTVTNYSGIRLATEPKYPYSSITFNFNINKLMMVSKIIFYVNNLETNSTPNVEVYLNGKKVDMNTLTYNTRVKAENITISEDQIASFSFSQYSTVWASSTTISNEPMMTLELRSQADITTILQLIGFRVNYNDIITGVESIQDEKNHRVEYFDLMGRKLATEPATGLFIVRNNGKTHKVLKP